MLGGKLKPLCYSAQQFDFQYPESGALLEEDSKLVFFYDQQRLGLHIVQHEDGRYSYTFRQRLSEFKDLESAEESLWKTLPPEIRTELAANCPQQ